MAKVPETQINNSVNQIGSGTSISGDINTSSDIRIDGSLEGNLTTNGKLVIGESGSVKGEVNCKNSVVSGKIEGKITVNELLSLKASSKIKGDIKTQKLHIEPGAVFTGTCDMTAGNATGNVSAGPKEESKRTK